MIFFQEASYDAYSNGFAVTKNRLSSYVIKENFCACDGNRVWAKDYEGYLATDPKVTTYIGNYYEVQVEGYVQPTGGTPTQPCTQTYCAYFPFVANTVTENISYYYADGQRIAMKDDGVVSYLYGDQLGSVSAVADGTGALVSKTLYHPWGTTRYTLGTTPTDYAYTGQMKEGDIYFYNARYYDPQLGRFMQADTLVPPTQGTQGFDRYAYINNNPVNGTDPTGHYFNNVLISDGGGGWEVPKLPNGQPNYAQGIREFGMYLVIPTSFSERELQTIYGAQVQFARGLERLGVSDGRTWMLKNLSGFGMKNYVPGMKENSFVVPGATLIQRNFTNTTWSVPRGTSGIMLMHEQTHMFSGMNTYIGIQNGPVNGLMDLIDVIPNSAFMFTPGSLIDVPPEARLNLGDGDYWMTAPSEYFSEVFTALLVDPNHSGVPEAVRQYMIDLIIGAE